MPRSSSKKGSKVETSTAQCLTLHPGDSISILLTGSPLSVNHLYGRTKTGRTYITKDGVLRKQAYAWETKVQYRGKPLECPVQVDIKLFYSTNRKRDTDNALKTIFDALTGIVLKDDSQIIKHSVEKAIDKANPRVELIITPYG